MQNLYSKSSSSGMILKVEENKIAYQNSSGVKLHHPGEGGGGGEVTLFFLVRSN